MEGCSEHGMAHIGSLVVFIESFVTMIRSWFSVFVFALLLGSVFPIEQISWAVDSTYGSTGDTGSEQGGNFCGTGAVNESEGDSQQETPDDCVAFGVNVSACGSSGFYTSLNKIPPSTLLVSRLFEPPAVHS